ncbi:MAG: hypothetical protein ABJP34_05000 [Erythrobacter sp.]
MKTITHAAALLAASIGLAAATPAAACRGPQFESSLVLFSSEKQAEVPKGMVQYRVRISDYSLRDVNKRDLIRVQVLKDEKVEGEPIDKATGRLMVVKPVGTSCDGAYIPPKGIYYLTGALAEDVRGKPISINGGKLFYPKFWREKSYPDFSRPAK